MDNLPNEGQEQQPAPPAPAAASGDEAAAFEEQKQLDPNKCANCGAIPEPGHLVPLCTHCRDKLSKHPVPYYIKAGLLVIAGLLIYAFTQFPPSLNAGVAFERGRRAESKQDYRAAAQEYTQAYKAYPKSDEIATRLAVSLFKAKDYAGSADIIDTLMGRKMSEKLVDELNTVIDALNAMIEESEKAGQAAKPAKGGAK